MRRATFFILCLEGAILSFNVAACVAIIPSFAREFAVTPFIAGRATWLYMFAYGIAALLYGPLARVIDAKKIELACFFLFCLSNLLAALSRGITMFFTARLLMGIFGASVIPLVLILIAQQTKDENRGRQVGIFFSATFVASLLGLFLSGVLNWRLIFLIPAIVGIILWIYMYIYLPSFKQDSAGLKANYLSALKDKTVVRVFTYIFFVSILYHAIQQWLGVYFFSRFNFNQFLISMLITLTSLSGIFGEVIGGNLADRIGRFKTVEWGIVLMILSVFLLMFKTPLIVLVILMIIWGLGWTLNHAGLSTMLTDLPKEFINEAASLNSSVRFISGGLGAACAGIVMQKSFNLGFFILGSGLVLLALFAKNLLIIK